jgi:hypothetical protein
MARSPGHIARKVTTTSTMRRNQISGPLSSQLYLSDSSAGTAPNADPSLDECRDAIYTAALPFRIQVKPNEGICIRSDEGHNAAIRVRSIDEATGMVSIAVVLWEETE